MTLLHLSLFLISPFQCECWTRLLLWITRIAKIWKFREPTATHPLWSKTGVGCIPKSFCFASVAGRLTKRELFVDSVTCRKMFFHIPNKLLLLLSHIFCCLVVHQYLSPVVGCHNVLSLPSASSVYNLHFSLSHAVWRTYFLDPTSGIINPVHFGPLLPSMHWTSSDTSLKHGKAKASCLCSFTSTWDPLRAHQAVLDPLKHTQLPTMSLIRFYLVSCWCVFGHARHPTTFLDEPQHFCSCFVPSFNCFNTQLPSVLMFTPHNLDLLEI